MTDTGQQLNKRSRLCVRQSKGEGDVPDSTDEGRIVCLYYKYVPVADVDAAIKDHEGELVLNGTARVAPRVLSGQCSEAE